MKANVFELNGFNNVQIRQMEITDGTKTKSLAQDLGVIVFREVRLMMRAVMMA
jgi:hypothetical protein